MSEQTETWESDRTDRFCKPVWQVKKTHLKEQPVFVWVEGLLTYKEAIALKEAIAEATEDF